MELFGDLRDVHGDRAVRSVLGAKRAVVALAELELRPLWQITRRRIDEAEVRLVDLQVVATSVRVVEIELDGSERDEFMNSVEAVKGLVEVCKKISPKLG